MPNQYYDITKCVKTGLNYVRFNKKGLEELTKKYQTKYPSSKIDIEILEIRDFEPEEFAKQIKSLFDKLEIGQAKGIITLKFSIDDESHIEHAMPFLILKNKNNQCVIVNFESNSFVHRARDELYFISYFKEVENYNLIQKDWESCTVLSLNTLKNCFLDEKFMKDAFEGLAKKVELSKLKYGQGQEMQDSMSEEQKTKYVTKYKISRSFLPSELKDVNMGLFYKGHKLACLLNDEHLEFISKESRKLVLEIDEKRREIKEKKASQKKDLDFSFEDFEAMLPNCEISNPSLEGKLGVAKDGVNKNS